MLRRIFCQKRRGKGDGGKNKEIVDAEPEVHEDEEEEVVVPKQKSLCYEIKTSEVMGRYLVASRDIKAGEVIIHEPALAVGPCSGCGIICLGCYRELEEDAIQKCCGCQWPICSTSCAGLGQYTGHSKYECDTLNAAPPNYADLEDLKDSYHALMPLRCLLLKKHDPEKWAKLQAMEAHNEIRKARGDIWPLNERLVVRRILQWGLPFDTDEIHTICGRPLTLRAAVPHAVGDLITLCYAYTLQGTLKRREHILHSKFFECSCARCVDPTELGTLASAFRCPRCGGPVLSTQPLQRDADWQCSAGCGYLLPARAAVALIQRLTDEYDKIDANDVAGFEGFLHKYRNVVHENHYLCLSCLHSLSQLYGKVQGYLIHEMPETELRRKADICRQLMTVFDVIEPGYSRLRGVTQYELHAPLMILATRDFEKKAISKENLRNRLKEIVGYLRQAALILGFEPARSAEGLMAAAARHALSKIHTWEQLIGKIS
ncbi:hypothetical protein ACJJTC_013320 [Scirpophaga incertulas]